MMYCLLLLLRLCHAFSPVPKDEFTIYRSLTCSPSGNYLAFQEYRFVDVQDGLGCRLIPWELRQAKTLIVDSRGRRLSVLQIADLAHSKAEWAAGDRLIMGSDPLGAIRSSSWSVYNVSGEYVTQLRLEAGFDAYYGWAISPNGRYLAYVGEPDRDWWRACLVVKNLYNGCAEAMVPLTFRAEEVVWSSSSKTLAAVGTEYILVLRLPSPELQTGEINVRRLRRGGYATITLTDEWIVRASSDGVSCLVIDDGTRISLGNVHLRNIVFAPGQRGVFAAFHHDGKQWWLVSGSLRGEKLVFEHVEAGVADFCWQPDGRSLFYLTEKGHLKTWRLEQKAAEGRR